MSTLELVQRFTERRFGSTNLRHPAVIVLEFGGGNCNKAGGTSCREFCAVPNGKIYDPSLDPSPAVLVDQFRKIAFFKPALVSIVPNGEAVIVNQESNTKWNEIFRQLKNGNLSGKQVSTLTRYYSGKHQAESINYDKAMSPAEKMAFSIALGKNAGLNLSLTTNGSFLNKDLIKLYREMGLEYINLSYHPNKPFDLEECDPVLEHLITKANEAIEVGVIPTITHVLTRQNADTFVALADYIAEHDILFAVGIANARGGHFSTSRSSIEPTDNQVRLVFRRLLARKLFADRHIRTTIPYLLIAPFLRQWVCGQSMDFLHISMEKGADEMLQSKLNVCSEVRSDDGIELGDFLSKSGFDNIAYFERRSKVMKDPEQGCPTCTHQCFFESETRGSINIGNSLELWDLWDSFGKGVRQRYISRHPIRPTVSQRKDFQNPYLWESLLQGIGRVVAGLKDSNFWQETFKRSGVSFNDLVVKLVKDALDPAVVDELVQVEKKEVEIKIWKKIMAKSTKRSPVFAMSNWHDASYFQSRFLRSIYLHLQKSGREAKLAIPLLKYREFLRHESPNDFTLNIESILKEKRREKASLYTGLLQFFKGIKSLLSSLNPLIHLYNWL